MLFNHRFPNHHYFYYWAWIVLCFALSSIAEAQQNSVESPSMGLAVDIPQGWKKDLIPDNQVRVLARFVHPNTQSRIEVLGETLINEDVISVFFQSFEQKLQKSSFQLEHAPQTMKAGDFEGKWSEYTFDNGQIVITIVVFAFQKDNRAFMVIGYFKKTEFQSLRPDLITVLHSLRDLNPPQTPK